MPKKTDDLDKNEDEDEDDTEDAPVVSPECMKYCQEETFSESGLRACEICCEKYETEFFRGACEIWELLFPSNAVCRHISLGAVTMSAGLAIF